MKQNLTLDYRFTNEGEPTGDIKVFNYDGTGAEESGRVLPAITELNGQLVFLLFRDGWEYRKVVEDPMGKQFTFDEETNITVFAPNLPAIQAGESIDIVYVDKASDWFEPVTLEDAKLWLRVSSDISTDDELIKTLIKAARKKIELYTGVSLIPRIVEAYVQIQDPPYELMFGPVKSIIDIADHDGKIFETDDYKLRGVAFKQLDIRLCHPAYVTYYTEGLANDEWNTYIKKQVAWLYDNRGDVQETRLAPALAIELQSKRRNL